MGIAHHTWHQLFAVPADMLPAKSEKMKRDCNLLSCNPLVLWRARQDSNLRPTDS
jgi:hypothetical protein